MSKKSKPNSGDPSKNSHKASRSALIMSLAERLDGAQSVTELQAVMQDMNEKLTPPEREQVGRYALSMMGLTKKTLDDLLAAKTTEEKHAVLHAAREEFYGESWPIESLPEYPKDIMQRALDIKTLKLLDKLAGERKPLSWEFPADNSGEIIFDVDGYPIAVEPTSVKTVEGAPMSTPLIPREEFERLGEDPADYPNICTDLDNFEPEAFWVERKE